MASFKEGWKTLRDAGFNTIDATFMVAGGSGINLIYFFKDSQYIKVSFAPDNSDYMIGNVQSIRNGWPSLNKANINKVDAVLRVKNYPSWLYPYHRAYFFSGDRYVYIKFKPGVVSDEIISGPGMITSGWSLLKKLQ